MRSNRRYTVDLPALHMECDANYARLMRLLPSAGASRVLVVAGAAEALSVELRVVERAPYTTTVEIEEQSGGSEFLPPLRLRVRMYHDASTAEVIEYQNEAHFWPRYRYPNARMRVPDEKHQINALLTEFLDGALRHGRAHTPLTLPE